MSDDEQRGWRDLTYNRWHRKRSLRRYIGLEAAHRCAMVDIDSFEYCNWCYEPLALVETARQRGPKTATATARLAKAADIPAYRLLYEVDDANEQHCDCGNITGHGEITRFWLSRIWPAREGEVELSPAEWANCLYQLRRDHYVICPTDPVELDLSTFISSRPIRDPRSFL